MFEKPMLSSATFDGLPSDSSPYISPGQNHSLREDRARSIIESGHMPPLGGGFEFVLDQRPPGEETSYIPAEDYTRYFSERKIPIAAPLDNPTLGLYLHDIGHIPSCQTMFGNQQFADMVALAATNALATPESCEEFTNTMDILGDCMRNLEERQDSGRTYIGDVEGALLNLANLVRLSRGDIEPRSSILEPVDASPSTLDPLVRELEQQLRLDRYRRIASNARVYQGEDIEDREPEIVFKGTYDEPSVDIRLLDTVTSLPTWHP
jgi:hypothetical protein